MNREEQIKKYGQYYDSFRECWCIQNGEAVAPPPFSAFGVDFGGLADPRYTPEEAEQWHADLDKRRQQGSNETNKEKDM